ncbi:MAG: DUF1579 family protein [candidate division Zixibacteria bacterium]|nr:DUF1579 family protein [candidate division Zixibacteria bacterium]
MLGFKNITFLSAIFCVVAIAAVGFARDSKTSDTSDSIEKRNVLSAELVELSFMLGQWSGTVESRRSPIGDFTSGKIDMTVRPILDGSEIETRYSGVVMNGTRWGFGRLSYNPRNKTFQRSWTDSLTSITLVSVGSFADNQLAMNGSGSFFGLKYLFREVTTNVSDTSMTWRGEISLNDGESWFVMLKGWFLRVG